MYLKRGVKRQSCDFCFRRKVRCDRLSRRSQNHSQCSHCELRDLPCIANPGSAGSPNNRAIENLPRSIGSPITSGNDNRLDVNNGRQAQASPNDTIIVGNDNVSPPLSTPAPNHVSNHVSPIAANIQHSAIDLAWPEIDWELGTESISFLDGIFTQNHNFDIISNMPPGDASGEIAAASQSPYELSGVDSITSQVAIEAYFDLASLALPILSREAFMWDYKSHKASPALVCAIACRGCPFISTAGKWTVQQQFASQFRQKFLEARLIAENEQSIRLDDLEALALMIDFAYKTSEDVNAPLHSQLGNLFLTHDSLVLMTLQYQILGHSFVAGGSSELLYGAEDRKRLLFWHVYGVDAFHTLQTKLPSRIRDTHLDVPNLAGHEERTYLDSILALAMIARNIHQTLPGPTLGQVVTQYSDVSELYDQLADWNMTLPSQLQICRSGGRTSCGSYNTKDVSPVHTLQQAVLAFLEHNCYMQIEACLSKSRIEDLTSIEAFMLTHLIEYKTLETTQNIIELVPWLRSQHVYHTISTGKSAYTVFDIIPGILRDICAGTSFWLCDRGKRILNRDTLLCPPLRNEAPEGTSNKPSPLKKGAESFAVGAATLRDAVATAGSHMDTPLLVEELDGQLSILKEIMKNINDE
ncbi:fungal transcriptional regulatory [Fusarium sporotrichioides]|uniref:Fungal transcriptional regulatory n=1 Tax=Fusarium sporotrichioides TaxID=5514 RepID=A0A395SNC6_FUSSP|nr:fungal transcriptional regulatory [Fusarium sporotrichioides]